MIRQRSRPFSVRCRMLSELGLQCNLSADAHATADALVDPLLHNLSAGVAAVGEACEQGSLGVDVHGMLHLPAVTALPEEGEPRR